MSRVLLSTTSGWNCGDDWIREGLLKAIRLRSDVDTIWWNRGWGIQQKFGNAPAVNLPAVDYVIIAGTPEWIDRTTEVYRHCLHTGTKMALLGIGKTGGYRPEKHEQLMRDVIDSGIIEIAIVRDQIAADQLTRFGVPNRIMCDPAMFYPPSVPGGEDIVIGWRGLGTTDPDRPYESQTKYDHQLSTHLWEEWEAAAGKNRMVIVHDNREIAVASELFGRQNVRYSSDQRELMHRYWRCGHYVGARIHGFVGSLIHGGSAHLIYHSEKAQCAQVIIDRLDLEGAAAVTISIDGNNRIPDLDMVKPINIWPRIDKEKRLFRHECLKAPGLRQLMEVS